MTAEVLDLIIGVAALVLADPTVTLEGEDAVHDTVEEVAVVGYRNHDAVEVVEVILEDGHRTDIEVVCRLVEDEDIRLGHKDAKQVEATLLAAAQLLDLHVLHGRREQEAVEHVARADETIHGVHVLTDGGHRIDDTLISIKCLILLAEIADPHSLADIDLAAVRGLPAGDHLDEVRLAGTVRTDDPDAVVSQEVVIEVIEEHMSVVGLTYIDEFDRRLAESGPDGAQLQRLFLRRSVHRGELFITLEAALLLRGTRLRTAHHPLQLIPEDVLTCPLLRAGDVHALGLQLEIAGVVRLIAVELALIELDDTVADLIEEVAVMGNHQQRSLVALEVVLEPFGHRAVEMIRRLVEDQQIGGAEQGTCERHTLLLSARELPDLPAEVVLTELRQKLLCFRLEVPDMLVAFIIMQDRLEDGILRVEGRGLREETDLELTAHRHTALIRLLEPRNDAEQRRLAGAVHADQRDLLALIDGKISVIKNLSLGIDLAEMFDRNDVVLCHTVSCNK